MEGLDYSIFVDCTPICPDIPPDPILSAMQEEQKNITQQPESPSQKKQTKGRRRVTAPKVRKPNGGFRRRIRAADFVLPPGWEVRRKTRKSGKSSGCTDNYYVEISTGNIERSRVRLMDRLAKLEEERKQNAALE